MLVSWHLLLSRPWLISVVLVLLICASVAPGSIGVGSLAAVPVSCRVCQPSLAVTTDA